MPEDEEMSELWMDLPPLQAIERPATHQLRKVDRLKTLERLNLQPLSHPQTALSLPVSTLSCSVNALKTISRLESRIVQLSIASLPTQSIHKRRKLQQPAEHDSVQQNLCKSVQLLMIGESSQQFPWNASKRAFDCLKCLMLPRTIIDDALQRAKNIRLLKSARNQWRADRSSSTRRACSLFLDTFVCKVTDECIACWHSQPSMKSLETLLDQCSETTAALDWLVYVLNLLRQDSDALHSNMSSVMEELAGALQRNTFVTDSCRDVSEELLTCLLEPLLAEIHSSCRLSLISVSQEEYLQTGDEAPSMPVFLQQKTASAIHEIMQGLELLFAYDRAAYDAIKPLPVPMNRISFLADVVDARYTIVQRWSRDEECSACPTTGSASDNSLKTSLADALDVHLDWPIEEQLHRVQAQILNLMLNNLRLRRHFELLEQVFFFGNGRFVVCLTDTLFVDTSANACVYNRAGQWPPSPMQMNVATRAMLQHSLDDCYVQQASLTSDQSEREYLGNLGFRLDEDVDHPQLPRDALNALSFLKFDFRPPPPLDQVITKQSLIYYSQISSFLLLLLQMVHVVDQLTVQARLHRNLVTHRVKQTIRFRLEALWFIQELARYCFERVVKPAWRQFLADLPDCAVQSPAAIRDRHLAMLTTISHGCLLDSDGAERMEAVRGAFQAIMTLHSIPADQREGWSADGELIEELHARFMRYQKDIRLDELVETADDALSVMLSQDEAEEDDEM